MMHDMMLGSGMMWAMGLAWLLLIVVLILGIAALVKFLFFNKWRSSMDAWAISMRPAS